MTTRPVSALMTAPGQILEFSPISTSPTIYAASLTNADAAIFGVFPLKLLITFSPPVSQ
jgi:hypothetical protein